MISSFATRTILRCTPLSLGMREAMRNSVLHTVIDVFQFGVFLDIDADPPAIQ
jgi:hypothetical protein